MPSSAVVPSPASHPGPPAQRSPTCGVDYPLQRRRAGNPDTQTGFVLASDDGRRPQAVQKRFQPLVGGWKGVHGFGKRRAVAHRSSHQGASIAPFRSLAPDGGLCRLRANGRHWRLRRRLRRRRRRGLATGRNHRLRAVDADRRGAAGGLELFQSANIDRPGQRRTGLLRADRHFCA